ncbi:MAG: PhoH family protein [Candidatus Omnitrophota bacterium]
MQETINLPKPGDLKLLFGNRDENLKLIEDRLQVNIAVKENGLKISGGQEAIENTKKIFQHFLEVIRSGHDLAQRDISLYLDAIKKGSPMNLSAKGEEFIDVTIKGRRIGPKTKGQSEYVEAMRDYDIVFGIGPAGTGKTYLAMAMAVSALKKADVRRIILTRPAIEAGESLGYLPGDMYDKISPYLRPLYDALYDMIDAEKIEKFLEMGIIEVAPLAYMRGRTLNDAFVILDEAQNCTGEQMKMFLTRLGFDSKTVITGDITQSDLPGGKPQGLLEAKEILSNIEGIKFIFFSGEDIVRHELVQKIIQAYERNNEK